MSDGAQPGNGEQQADRKRDQRDQRDQIAPQAATGLRITLGDVALLGLAALGVGAVGADARVAITGAGVGPRTAVGGLAVIVPVATSIVGGAGVVGGLRHG